MNLSRAEVGALMAAQFLTLLPIELLPANADYMWVQAHVGMWVRNGSQITQVSGR